MNKAILIPVLLGALIPVSPLMAHHSPVMFAVDQRLTLSGRVREFQWTNPHSYIQLQVAGEDGVEEEWSLEMGANVYLFNQGWRPSTLRPGDRINVTLMPLRNGARGGLVLEVMTTDGVKLGGNLDS